MDIKYYGRYDSDGKYLGFYTSDTWDEKDIPMDECVELTKYEWIQAREERCAVVDGKHKHIPLTQEEIDASKLRVVRAKRDKLLQESDWTQMVSDIPMSEAKKEEWRIYRQALRDLPNTVDLNNIIYPQKPQ